MESMKSASGDSTARDLLHLGLQQNWQNRRQSRQALILTTSMLVILLLPVSAAQAGGEEPYRLSDENKRLFFYGETTGDAYTEWPVWNHARNSDPESADSIGETNALIPGPNNGGGSRSFTFDGTYPNNVTIELDPLIPITGQMRLNIVCQGTCSKAVTLYLRLGEQDMTQLAIDAPDEGTTDVYSFEFFPDTTVVKDGETFGIRVEFSKPGQIGDGYTLYLGANNFWMDVPVLPPETTVIPDVQLNPGDTWNTPYSKSDMGFSTQTTSTVSLVIPLLIIILFIGAAVSLVVFTPALPMKGATVALVAMSMILTSGLAPIISWYDVSEHNNIDTDPNTFSVADIAQMEANPGAFLGDFTPGDKFQIWIEFEPSEVVYVKDGMVGNQSVTLYGFSHRMHNAHLSDLEMTTLKGREAAQLYFSMVYVPKPEAIEAMCAGEGMHDPNATSVSGDDRMCLPFDPAKGAGIMLDVTLMQGIGGVIMPEESMRSRVNMSDGTPRAATPWYAAEIMGEPQTWNLYPLLGLLPAAGLAGFGVYVTLQDRKLDHSDWADEDDDDDWADEEFDEDDDEDLD